MEPDREQDGWTTGHCENILPSTQSCFMDCCSCHICRANIQVDAEGTSTGLIRSGHAFLECCLFGCSGIQGILYRCRSTGAFQRYLRTPQESARDHISFHSSKVRLPRTRTRLGIQYRNRNSQETKQQYTQQQWYLLSSLPYNQR